MDIRTKLVFALVALALGSMLTLGAFMYASADRSLNASTRKQLEALAVSREQAIEGVLAGWRERVQLIASRTQLRLSLRDYESSGDADELARIRRILDDALVSVRTVLSLAIYDRDGSLVVAVSREEDGPSSDLVASGGPESAGDVEYRGVSFMADGQPRIAFTTDLILERAPIGTLLVLLDGAELVGLTNDYTGLGDTGEVLIVMRDGDGIRTLHPVRDGPDGHSGPLLLEGAADPVVRAVDRDGDMYSEDVIDYRGERVWAATRHIPDTGWGLVVKFDEAEERRTINEFRGEMTTLALSLSAFAILFAVLLGIRFATPIHHLAAVANRIRGGELHARAAVEREDEIGLLARTFNQMAEKLEQDMIELHDFHKFFEVSLDMLCIAGTDGFFKRVNPAFERTLGWSNEELLSQPFLDLVHPDDVAATTREIEKLAEGIPTISFINHFLCADGTYKCLRWTSHPEPETGLLYAVARELTEPPTAP